MRLATRRETRHNLLEMFSVHTTLRTVATWFFGAVVVAIVVSVGGQWFIQVATDKGWYVDAGMRWDRGIRDVFAFVTTAYVLYSTVGLAGFVVGLWADALLVRRDRKAEREVNERPSEADVVAFGRDIGNLARDLREMILARLNERNRTILPPDDGSTMLAQHGKRRDFDRQTEELLKIRYGADILHAMARIRGLGAELPHFLWHRIVEMDYSANYLAIAGRLLECGDVTNLIRVSADGNFLWDIRD